MGYTYGIRRHKPTAIIEFTIRVDLHTILKNPKAHALYEKMNKNEIGNKISQICREPLADMMEEIEKDEE